MSRVVVVGGGLAGLAAAIRAADDGAEVELFERAPRLGGATWSFTHDGLTYDNGQHVFMRCNTEYRAFLDRIGSTPNVRMQDRMNVAVRRVDGTVCNLRRVRSPAPLHLLPALMRYRHLGYADRARTIRAARALGRLDLGDAALDSRTFGAWLADNGASTEAIAALWDLVCLPTLNLHADEASLLLAAKVFRTGLLDHSDGGDIGWAAVPLEQVHGLPAARVLADLGATVRTSTPIESLRSSPDAGPTTVVDGQVLKADAIIVAVPHDAVNTLLAPGSFGGQADVGGLGRSPIINVHLQYDRPVMNEHFVAGLDSPVQFVFDRTVASGAPPGHQCVAISLSAATDYLSWSRDELVRFFSAELARLLPRAREAQIVTSMVTREVAATFRGVPGSAGRRPGTTTRLPGVFLAGAWTDTGWPATMEGAVRSGIRAAAAANAYLAAVGD